MAGTPERWEWLQSAAAIFKTMGLDKARLVTPAEIKEMCPICDVSGLLWRSLRRRRGLSRPLWHDGRLRRRGQEARRRADPAQPRAGAAPAARRVLGGGHRAGHRPRRARRQRRRPLGQAGRADGRRRPAGDADGAPLPGHREHSRDRGHGPRDPADRRPRGLHLHAPGGQGRARRRLRARPAPLAGRGRALGLRHRADPRGHRPHLARARQGL